MIDVGYNQLISNKHQSYNCFVKKESRMLLDLADLDLARIIRRQFDDRFFSGMV